MRRIIAAVFAQLVLVSTVRAEAVNLMGSEYKPVVSTKAGRIELCGVHFSAVISTLEDRIFNIQGSVNSAYFEGRIPSIMIKITASEVINKDLDLVKRKLQHASLRVEQTDTNSLNSFPGDDGNSILLLADASRNSDFFSTFPELFYQGAWISISFDRRRGDYTFRLPAFGKNDLDTLKQVTDCNILGLNNLKREIESLPHQQKR